MAIRYLHTMVRVLDLDKSVAFYQLLGLVEKRRTESEKGRYTLVFMCAPGQDEVSVELTYNWDGDTGLPSDSRHFGHLAYRVDDIYGLCQRLMDAGVTINRPPRDGHMAFVRSPDNVSIELLQEGEHLAPAEPWASMPNTGHW
ncbi:VOC family protein [Ketogulonicigenium vulgare]|uniref:Lactoylglutathione lyase, putative n=1 Tax=Ketogulonicigenium vulgare (strain WSH-001) TaxID=759362 RepID=F9Y491_KETVW|nr:VOC family protein [Ketogulonicigenium vulgare]ADO42334.1 glyoxalase/bleomycin resistance protein/dioxygenase [Ketogulonicigenium vulgare Y25]AEM40527.1 Lactoylglutathione lyase, putative [Ketogulonicigenium vulgare WSH-001]ALJ80714.1 glyoxalase [Ketogulonicigenium vulgare]ANW33516.1 lactoylglutathione lyase [Ketogulonicigenium vulgare]AOZ54246.1 glyoxalase/bleomycin resistance protein/dioxygenase [Ketogulonicigenium vulgare]